MSELFDKISSYNIFNNLFPGVVFAVMADKIGYHNFVQQDVLIGVFIYYFIGLVISRIGSVAIEPVLKRIAFVRYAAYKDYVKASKTDDKIELLSEVNNMYRTLCSLFVFLLFLKGYQAIEAWYPVLSEWIQSGMLSLLLVLFLFSYRKQTTFIANRVSINL